MRDNDNMAYPLSPADTESDTSSNADPWSPAPSTPSSTSDDLPPSPDSSPAPSPHPAYYHRDGPAYHQHRGHAHGRWDDSKRESLLSAVRRGDCTELGLLLRGEDVNVNVIDGHGQTPLHQGCMDGNLEMVKLLVHHGADVRLANRDGWSPLHLATFCGNYEIVTYLVGNMNSRAS